VSFLFIHAILHEYNGRSLFWIWKLTCLFSHRLTTLLWHLTISFLMTIRNKPEVIDPPQNKDMTDIVECVNSPAKTALKPNVTVSSSVHELLECPVCLNAMYPPIHQVCFMPFLSILD